MSDIKGSQLNEAGKVIFRTPDFIDEPLYVVTCIFNPIRYKSRWKHYQRFAEHVHASGGILYTIEASFGERHHALDEIAPEKVNSDIHSRGNLHRYFRVNTSTELWVKENLINMAIARLPADWKYVAIVDADVMFGRTNWVGETIHQLQHYPVVQMFSHAQDVDSNYAPIATYRGFADCYLNGASEKSLDSPLDGGTYYSEPSLCVGKPILWHPGFAWAYRRDAFNDVGGLIDYAVLGAADRHMACALIGKVEKSINPKLHPEYKKKLLDWQWHADHHIRRKVGVVTGLLVHYWHGSKTNRRYKDRWKILIDNKYDPTRDIKYDWQGLIQLVDRFEPRSIKLRDEIMTYFRQRNEDQLSD